MPHSAFRIDAGECDSIQGQLTFVLKNGETITVSAKRDVKHELLLYIFRGTKDKYDMTYSTMRLSKSSISMLIDQEIGSSAINKAVPPTGV